MSDEIKVGPLQRDLPTAEIGIGKRSDNLTRLQFSASSEAPVERFFGTEILVHEKDSIDMTRMNGGAVPLLFNHDWSDPIGMIDRGAIENRRLMVDAHLFATGRAKEVEAMVAGGLRNVSIGYQIDELEEGKRGEFRVTRFTPLEVSIVSVPADSSVGIGRGKEGEAVTVRVKRATDQPAAPAALHGGHQMADSTNAAAGAQAEQAKVEAPVVETRVNPVESESKRKQAIVNLCRANKIDERIERQWIESGADMNEVSEGIVQVLAERSKNNPATPARIDMSTTEVRKYSMLRAIRAAMTRDWTHAGLELEAHKAVMKRINGQPRTATSFYIPLDVQERQFQTRDMTAAGASGSNYLVSTDNLAGSFIDYLRNRSVTMQLGATRLSGLQGNLTIPRETATATAYWLADETTAITESQPTLGQLSLSPKNVAALTEFTHQLLQQSSPNVEEFLMRALAKDVAIAADVGALRGAGTSGQPTGITTTSGIGTFTVDNTDTIGDLLNAQSDVAAANALAAGCAYVTTPGVAAILRARTEFSSTDTPLWRGNILDGQILGFRAMSSNQMSASTMIFGDFSQLIWAEWGVLELTVNPFSDFTRGYQQIRAWYTMDVGVRYAGAFSYCASAT